MGVIAIENEIECNVQSTGIIYVQSTGPTFHLIIVESPSDPCSHH